MKPIATLTMNPTLDIYSQVNEVVPYHKLRCEAPRRDPGGGGINVARAIHRLGGSAVALYIAGGTTGQLLHKLLRREGIEGRRIEIEKLTRENFMVTEAGTGRHFRFLFPGPELRRGEWQQSLEMLGLFSPIPAYIVASGTLPPGVPADFYARAAQVARRIGARLILDTAGDALGASLGENIFLVKPNRRELEALTGRDLADPAAQEEACRQLVAAGKCEIVILTLAGEGALLTTRNLQIRATAPKVPIVSPVGAGDSFLGGMTLALARGWPLTDAFRFGLAAGTAAVLTPGTELCRLEDTERLYAQIGKETGGGGT
jgi:6-phosphofructokinase 2